MGSINFENITTQAYQELIRKKIERFPVDPRALRFDGILILSFQDYCDLADVSVSLLTAGGELCEGYSCKNIRPGLKLILYNANTYEPRQKHTFVHEVGHLQLDHTRHGDQEEVEAHFYASQFLMPNAVLHEIKDRGYILSKDLLMQEFEVSEEAANKRINFLTRFPASIPNFYDDVILQLFAPFLDERFRDRRFRREYEYDLEMEKERQSWY